MGADSLKIPVSVLITTKNEEVNIARCLRSVDGFGHVAVIDSHSDDRTVEIAREFGVDVYLYQWNGRYPKKRQWCLDVLDLPYDWVLWLDADEVLTHEIIDEMRRLFDGNVSHHGGFFVRGLYVWGGRVLKYGLRNNKVALMNKNRMLFPVVDDLDIDGMGEMEGHYQPVLKDESRDCVIGQLRTPILHYAYENGGEWQARHMRYARWEAEMNYRDAWPKDPIWWREVLKRFLRRSVLRGVVMFVYSYVFRCGFLDGRAGFDIAKSRYDYCVLIRRAFKKL